MQYFDEHEKILEKTISKCNKNRDDATNKHLHACQKHCDTVNLSSFSYICSQSYEIIDVVISQVSIERVDFTVSDHEISFMVLLKLQIVYI